MGKPLGFIKGGQFELLYYPRGRVKLAEGVVVESDIVSKEAYQQQQVERAVLNELRRKKMEEIKRKLYAEGLERKQEILNSIDYRMASSKEKVAVWRAFKQSYPNVSIDEEYVALLKVRESELKVEAQEKKIEQLEARVRTAENQAAATREEARNTRHQPVYVEPFYVEPTYRHTSYVVCDTCRHELCRCRRTRSSSCDDSCGHCSRSPCICRKIIPITSTGRQSYFSRHDIGSWHSSRDHRSSCGSGLSVRYASPSLRIRFSTDGKQGYQAFHSPDPVKPTCTRNRVNSHYFMDKHPMFQ